MNRSGPTDSKGNYRPRSSRTTLSDDTFRDTFRRVLKRIAEADGTIDTQEKQATKLMIDAIGS
jgi:hypothetical protein